MVAVTLSATLIAVMVLAAWTDIRARRIPNALTATAFVLALVLRGLIGGGALADGLLGGALALGVLLPLFAMGGVGGGDAKLLVAAGALLGVKGFVVALLATAVAGGLMSVAYAARRGVILPALLNTRSLLSYLLTAGRRGERTTLASPGAVSVPYGVAIAVGSLFALCYGAVVAG